MSETPKLLVVDDEEVICQACRRVFSRQGFQVEVSTDACVGLNLAREQDYRAVLLDIKMPKLDGIQFLERLRETKPDMPVLIMTGYPSVPNAAAAIRLGASDYITKPFTPEEITRAVQRILSLRGQAVAAEGAPPTAAPVAHPAPGEEILFFDEAWFRLEPDGSACVGAVVPGLRGATIQSVRLPRIGEVVYQGLPLAAVAVQDKPMAIIPAPVSGVVGGVNEALGRTPALVASDPCGEGWLACICTTRYEEEVGDCKPRRVILANAERNSAADQSGRLKALGCHVPVVGSWAELMPAVQPGDWPVLFVDAPSFREQGPELVAQVNVQAPKVKIVVVACPDGQFETAYRKHRIFYYAVEPFADNEVADILDAAFRAHEFHPSKVERPKAAAESISSIAITNRNGHKVHLLAAPGLLRRHEGLGCQIARKLQERALPIVVTPGEANLTPANLIKAAGACDRLMVLVSKDSGLLPGALARDTKPDFGTTGVESPGKVTVLALQPDAVGGLSALDARTTAALAEHMVREMASY